MARHAGFGAVATITEALVNDVVATYARNSFGPRFFPLPQTINVNFVAVTFGGVMEMLAPKIELHANPADLVRVHFSFQSTLRAQFSGQPMRTWAVQLDGTVDVGLITTIQNDQIILGINTRQVVFQPLAVTVLKGSQIPSPIQSALQSQAMADLATAFVQALPSLVISPPLLSARINFTQPSPKDFLKFGLSEFDWFHVDLTASRIVVKPMEHAVTVAVDFIAGPDGRFTTIARGNSNQLVDLIKVRGPGSIYTYTINQRVVENPPYEPFLVPSREPGGGSIAAVFNMEVIAFVIANQISPQLAGTPIAQNVNVNSIGVAYATFQKPLLPIELAQQDGLEILFSVATAAGDINGRVLLQTYRETFDLPTASLRDDSWLIYAAQAEINLPLWVNVSVVGLGVILAYALPILTPFIEFGVTEAISEISNIVQKSEAKARQSLQRVGFPMPSKKPLPGLTKPDWGWAIKYASFTSESFDTAIYPLVEIQPEEALGVISPAWWSVYNRNPIPVTLKIRSDLETLAGNNLMLNWEVRRADTNQLVTNGVKAYSDSLGDGVLIVLIPHHTPELYAVDDFIVSVTATITLGSQVGEIWSGSQTIPIVDSLDRHHKYVHWGPIGVFFMNAGTDKQWWTRVRRSRIHRTALSARCREVRRSKKGTRKYFDTLPFEWEDLNQHRIPLCEYCFFGGPDKSVPFPEEDWF